MKLYDLLCGVAVADAVGNPLEFKKPVTAKDVIKSFAEPVLKISDDTQMTLFLVEGLSQWNGVMDSFRDCIAKAYLRWYVTQGGASMTLDGLLSFQSMYNVEAPGNTCMKAMLHLREGLKVLNDSKGNGTVMRCSPIALYTLDWSESAAVTLARLDARLTHKHPNAYVCSELLVLILRYLMQGVRAEEAVSMALKYLRWSHSAHKDADKVLQLISLATTETPRPMPGWVAEEALYVAVGSLLWNDSYDDAVAQAMIMSDDSDTAAAITGAMAVCAGMMPNPKHVEKLNALDAIKYVSELPAWK